jgi:hypothetical protein
MDIVIMMVVTMIKVIVAMATRALIRWIVNHRWRRQRRRRPRRITRRWWTHPLAPSLDATLAA